MVGGEVEGHGGVVMLKGLGVGIRPAGMTAELHSSRQVDAS